MTDVACTSPVILRNRSEDSWGWIVNNSSSAPKQQFLLGENHCPSLTKGWEEKSSISCVKRNVFLWQQLWNWNSAASQPSKWWSSQLLKILDHCCAKNKELVKNDVFLQDLFVFKKIMKERIETLKSINFKTNSRRILIDSTLDKLRLGCCGKWNHADRWRLPQLQFIKYLSENV